MWSRLIYPRGVYDARPWAWIPLLGVPFVRVDTLEMREHDLPIKLVMVVIPGVPDDSVSDAVLVVSRKLPAAAGADLLEARHERTRRAMAADASATFSSALRPPALTASVTQWVR